ncbi:MAG: hypothetical protein ACK4RK_21675 [Gemmataceae bacterium]
MKLTAEVDQRGCYKPDGSPREFTGERINWYGRDQAWKNVKGFRGENDIEKKAALDVLIATVNSADWNATLHATRTLQLLDVDLKPILPALGKRLTQVRPHEGKETLALFVRYALEGALKKAS